MWGSRRRSTTFQAIGAEFEIARTRLTRAAEFFEAVPASSYVARVAEQATRLGVNLAAGRRTT